MAHYSLVIEGRDFGTFDTPAEYRHGQLYPPSGYAWFCPQCGEVWARAAVEGRPFTVWTRRCIACPGLRYEFAGSIILDWEREFNEALPRAVKEREMALHLAWAEQEKEAA